MHNSVGLKREFIPFLIMSSFPILRLVGCVVCCESSFACVLCARTRGSQKGQGLVTSQSMPMDQNECEARGSYLFPEVGVRVIVLHRN